MEIKGKRDQVILKDKSIREPVTVKECINCTIDNCDFQYDRTDTTLLYLSNCQKMKVTNCKFHDKSTKGLFIKIAGSNSKDNLVENCELWNHTFNKENGGEPMRIGNSDVSGCYFNTIVRKNTFHDLRSDVETISIKSCGNLITENLFENNQSMIAVRHGGFNKITKNVFKGSGGIRILGTGNEITDNFFSKNKERKGRYVPIVIEWGNVERDPNFTNDNKPTGKGGSSHAKYAQVRDNVIANNKFLECTVQMEDRKKDRQYGPVNNKTENNNTVTTPPPVTSIPEQPEEPEEPEPVDPEEDKPEPEEPTVPVEPLPPQPTTADIIARLEALSQTIAKIQAFIDNVLAKLKVNEQQQQPAATG